MNKRIISLILFIMSILLIGTGAFLLKNSPEETPKETNSQIEEKEDSSSEGELLVEQTKEEVEEGQKEEFEEEVIGPPAYTEENPKNNNVENNQPINKNTFTTSKGFTGEVIDGATYIDGILIANKTYSLPSSYGNGLTSETQSAFNTMKIAAKNDGINLYISSGFRSYSYQKNLYNNYVARDGQTKADTYSARPGHSEHQSGLAFDVNTVGDSFAGTPEAIWLENNCYKYGFVLRYPQEKTDETGYKYEPWHFRYVGVELATKLYNGGNWITMEDYFGITSKYAN